MIIACSHCGKEIDKPIGAVNRAKSINAPLFCNMVCAGLARRKDITDEQFKANKREYDKEYRAKNRAMLKAKKAAHFKATYDPAKASVERKKNMQRHVEYCRQPEYKAKKVDYDQQYRATKLYGEFAECAILVEKINKTLAQKANKSELRTIQGTNNKSKRRKKQWLRLMKNLPQLT